MERISGASAGMTMLVTHIAASTSSFTWMCIEWAHKKKPTLIGAVSGAVTGLVVITPAAGYVDQTGAFVMGLIGALSCYPIIVIKNRLGYDQKALKDEYPDAFGVHAIGGMVGCFWTGLFANPDIHNRRTGVPVAAGAFYFNADQLGWQIVGIIFTVLWSATITAVLLFCLKFTIGINAPEEESESEPELETANPVMKSVSPPPRAEYVHPLQMSVMQPMPYGYPQMARPY